MNLSSFVTDDLLEDARKCARARLADARKKQRTQPYGDPGDGNRIFIDAWSSLAEALVAAWLNVEWHSEIIDDLSVKLPDIGNRTDIKWTPIPKGHLIVHDNDHDDWLFVLVCGELPDMRVGGWTTGGYAKRYPAGAKARNATDHWVPQGKLLLPELLFQMRRGYI